jgi:heme-degrading monooxygenase HmoA
MVMTILEAIVDRQNWATLETVYKAETKTLDPGIVQTFLIHSRSDDQLWRILTVWESAEALNAMRQSGEIPRGVQMFQAAHAQPALGVFDIVAEARL